MIDPRKALDILAASDVRRAARRQFLKVAGGSTLVIGASTMLAGCFNDDDDPSPAPSPTPSPSPTPTPTAITDPDILNLALNLEYL
ncbi:hypothetical protein FHS94_003973, partial [Sphingomonas aerophila]|nr:hypothetical protein [Sphingomonas aerophila]